MQDKAPKNKIMTAQTEERNLSRRSFITGAVTASAVGGVSAYLYTSAHSRAEAPLIRLNMVSWTPGDNFSARWEGFDENGRSLGSATGDHASLTQDVIGLATDKGIPLCVTGRTHITADAIKPHHGSMPVLFFQKTVTVPPSVLWSMTCDNAVIQASPKDGGPGLVFDSCEDLTFMQRGGHVGYKGDSAAVRFAPKSTTNADFAILQAVNKFYFQAITVNAGSSSSVAVEWDLSEIPVQNFHTGIWGNQYNFGEVDGMGFCRHTMRVTDPPENVFFENNQITASLVVNATESVVRLGTDGKNLSGIRHNMWRFGSIQAGNKNCDGFYSYGSYDRLEVGVIGDDNMSLGLNRGIVFQPGTVGNRYSYGHIYHNSGPVVEDLGKENVRF